MGWYLPSVISLGEMERLLMDANFASFSFRALAPHILPSAKIICQSAEESLRKEPEFTEVIYLSRKAAVVCGRLYEGDVLRYCFLSAMKP